jgi:tetraacyldisaccharide 4'-kinase
LISALYAAIACGRRRWYARHPEARRRLGRPVVSVGNLSLGGTGKTPTVAHLARLLAARGERPSILSRGYGRASAPDGVVVVREPGRVVGDLPTAGDEPLMLARALDGVAVLVSPDRYLAGCLAERRFDCTVHLLDDGFQHLALARDVDLLLVGEAELTDGRTLPSGRLREPLEALRSADAVILEGVGPRFFEDRKSSIWKSADLRSSTKWGLTPFELLRRTGTAYWLHSGEPAAPDAGRALALAAIARPERFVADAHAAGWTIVSERSFRDHHPFSRADVEAIVRQARAAGADLVLTTEKDLVRLAPHAPFDVPVAALPLEVTIEPADEFAEWLTARLRGGRA